MSSAREASDGMSPRVERSETRGSNAQKTCELANASDGLTNRLQLDVYFFTRPVFSLALF